LKKSLITEEVKSYDYREKSAKVFRNLKSLLIANAVIKSIIFKNGKHFVPKSAKILSPIAKSINQLMLYFINRNRIIHVLLKNNKFFLIFQKKESS